MTQTDCETIRQAAMALADGETAPLSAEQVKAHLAGCPACGRAVEELQSLTRRLDSQSRQRQPVDLWSRVQGPIAGRTVACRPLNSAGMLVALVLALLCVHGIVLGTAEPLAWVARCVALVFLGGWFFLLRENPFAIQSRLVEAKEVKP